MFRGANLLNIDAKGRMAMPTKHREVLLAQSSGELVITAHPHGCLLIYPQIAWEPIQSKIMALSSFDKKSSALQRLLVGYAEDISLDTVGRLLLSQVLREFARIDKQAMLVGPLTLLAYLSLQTLLTLAIGVTGLLCRVICLPHNRQAIFVAHSIFYQNLKVP